MAASTKKILIAAAAIAVAAFLVWGVMQSATPPRAPLQGQIEAQEINVSSKVPGRVGKIDVQLGQAVRQGDILFELDSPEVQAKVAQARAAQDAVQATYSKAQAGARPEEITMARYNWERAQTGARIAHATYERVQAMYKEGVIAQQKRDEAEAQWRAAEQLAQAARAQYDMAQHGARPEDKRAVEAQTRQVAGVVAEAQVALSETQIKSPGHGEVNKISIQPGELAPQGFPVVTIVNLADAWAVVTVREDELKSYALGTPHTGHLPALKTDVPFKVSFVSAMPDFATWKAARPGGTDLRTFEVRLRPTKPVADLRPGMSVVFSAE